MRYLELLENDAPVEAEPTTAPAQAAPSVETKEFFHVTTKPRLKKIQELGIKPNHNRRWKTGFGQALGERGNIYLMSDFTAAVRWAYKMQWEHFHGKPPEPSPYVIIKVRENPANLEPDPHPENGLYGHSWFQKRGSVPPEDILQVIPLTKELTKQVATTGKAVMERDSMRGLLSNYSHAKCVRALLAKGWNETTTPDDFRNPDYPEFSVDLNIHSPDPRGPFTVFQGPRKLMVTKVPPDPHFLRYSVN